MAQLRALLIPAAFPWGELSLAAHCRRASRGLLFQSDTAAKALPSLSVQVLPMTREGDDPSLTQHGLWVWLPQARAASVCGSQIGSAV